MILREKLICICNRDQGLFLREREPILLERASRLADQYKEIRYVDILSLTYKNNDRSRSHSESMPKSPLRRGPFPNNRGTPSTNVKCFNCTKPHLKRYCPEPQPGIMRAGAADYRSRSLDLLERKFVRIRNMRYPKKASQRKRSRKKILRCVGHAFFTDTVKFSEATSNTDDQTKTSVAIPVKVSSVNLLLE